MARLEEMRIRPGKNGGHSVIHSFPAKARLAKGALSGGMMMDRPEEKSFNFGPTDHQKLLKHIVGALALKGIPALGGAGGGSPTPSPNEEEPGPEGEAA